VCEDECVGEMELFWPVAAVRSKLMDEAITAMRNTGWRLSSCLPLRITGIKSRSSQTGTTIPNQTQRASQAGREMPRA